MALVFLGFVSVLFTTFVAVFAVTRQSPHEQTIAQRMASIHVSMKKADGSTPDIEQLLKATRRSKFGWLEEVLQRFRFARALHIRILQAHSSTSVAGLLLTQCGPVHGRVYPYVAFRVDGPDRPWGGNRTGLTAVRNSFLQAGTKNQRIQLCFGGVH